MSDAPVTADPQGSAANTGAPPVVAAPSAAFDMAAMVAELTSDEGYRVLAYDDATGMVIRPGYTMKGHPTVGVGRCLDTMGLRDEEISYLLAGDITERLDGLKSFSWFTSLDGVRQRAIVNMAFQLGRDGLLEFTSMIKAIAAKDYAAAAYLGLQSKWASETPARAMRVMTMLKTGEAETTVKA